MFTRWPSSTSVPSLMAVLLSFLALAVPRPGEAFSLEKRAPFSSWAGKRSSGLAIRPGEIDSREDLAQLLHDLQELYLLTEQSPSAGGYAAEEEDDEDSLVKRAPFSSWAGKRAPFSSWAGKRKRAPFNSWAGKRAPFSSWAGKRSAGGMAEDEGEKHRVKRSSAEEMEEEQEEQEHLRQRRGAAESFSTWGGKRSQLRRFTRNAPGGGVPVRVLRPQRAAFSAWGG